MAGGRGGFSHVQKTILTSFAYVRISLYYEIKLSETNLSPNKKYLRHHLARPQRPPWLCYHSDRRPTLVATAQHMRDRPPLQPAGSLHSCEGKIKLNGRCSFIFYLQKTTVPFPGSVTLPLAPCMCVCASGTLCPS